MEKELAEQEEGMGWLLKQMGRKTSLYRHNKQDDTLLKGTENRFKYFVRYFQAYVVL